MGHNKNSSVLANSKTQGTMHSRSKPSKQATSQMHQPKPTKTLNDFDTTTLNESEKQIVDEINAIMNANKSHHSSLKAKVKSLRAESKKIQLDADKLNGIM